MELRIGTKEESKFHYIKIVYWWFILCCYYD